MSRRACRLRRLRLAATAGAAFLALSCGGPLPEEWAPGTFCGAGEPEKEPMGGSAPILAGTGTWGGAIVNGEPAPDPSVVELSEGEQNAVGALVDRYGGGNFCTATLIGDNAVLTAAHCVVGRAADELDFAVGPDASRPLHRFQFSAVHVNPLWDGGSASHDNAVCVLDGLASEDYPAVTPFEINDSDLARLDPAFVGGDVQNVGYGTTNPMGGSNTRRWWTVEEIFELGMADYTTWGGGTSAVCFGDSGSPGLVTFPDGLVRVVGTLNGGDADCVSYDHWARTDRDATWIASFVVELPRCRWGLAGHCNGDTAEWCVGEDPATDLRHDDCGARGRVCGEDADGDFRCLAGERCPTGLTWQGRCEGDVAVWCDPDLLVRRRHCLPCGQTCGWVDASLGYYCQE
ncbi:MAG: trypsin-like serine protease [Deltaproteobacteria bacterium]|nr:trypsin-like serine protease [Deltaproteobacteria bacterium]